MRAPSAAAFLLGTLLILETACQKGNSASPAQPTTFQFVNVSLNWPNVDIYDNGSLLFPNLIYPDSTGYLQELGVKGRLALVSPQGTDSLVNLPGQTGQVNIYTIFLIDSSSSGAQVAVIPDVLPATHAGYAALRFLNFSASVPNLDLYASSLSEYLFTDRYFDEQDAFSTSFAYFPSGVYNLQLRVPGAFVALASLNGANLQDGKCYTLFSQGSASAMGDSALSIGIVQHN
jgi:hypothetical protein